MRAQLAAELQANNAETRALRAQVDDLIRALRESSAAQVAATASAAQTTARAVVNAVESVSR